MKYRTEKQKQAQERNWKIMRIKGIISALGIDFFTQEERKIINDICVKALSRIGAKAYISHDKQPSIFDKE